MIKAIIFDRDATLNRTTNILRTGQKSGDKTDGYVLAREELELFPAVKTALTMLRQNDITPFVFTQQNCIGKKLITEDGVNDIHAHMNELLGADAQIEDFNLAWNVPGEPESPRAKPNPTLIFELLDKHGLKKEDVLVVGDSMRDYTSSVNAGTAYAWVKDDKARVPLEEMTDTGCPVFDDVLELTEHYLLKKAA